MTFAAFNMDLQLHSASAWPQFFLSIFCFFILFDLSNVSEDQGKSRTNIGIFSAKSRVNACFKKSRKRSTFPSRVAQTYCFPSPQVSPHISEVWSNLPVCNKWMMNVLRFYVCVNSIIVKSEQWELIIKCNVQWNPVSAGKLSNRKRSSVWRNWYSINMTEKLNDQNED